MKDLIVKFWVQLRSKLETEALNRHKNGYTLKFHCQKLFGWEFMDIVNSEPG